MFVALFVFSGKLIQFDVTSLFQDKFIMLCALQVIPWCRGLEPAWSAPIQHCGA
jgi:hypothetical protein